MKYTAHVAVIAYICLFASLVQAKENPHTPPVVTNPAPQQPMSRGGSRRMNGGTESNGDTKKKDNAGYVPPNHGGPDSQFPHGTGNR